MSQETPPPEPTNPEEAPDFSETEADRGEGTATPFAASTESEWIEDIEPQPLSEPTIPRPTIEPQSRTQGGTQGLWETWQPRLRRQAVTILRSTSRTLDRLATRLDADSSATEVPQQPGSTPRRPASEPVDWLETLKELGQSAWNGWKRILPKIRGRLPDSLNQILSSDQALTGAIAGILLLLLWTVNGIVSPAPPKPVTVAVKPVEVPKPTPSPTPVETPAVQLPAPSIVGEPSPSPALEQPKETPVPTPSPEVTPPPPPKPPLKLTPEQKLIARIQDEVAEISDQYVSGLIQSVQANFRASRLVVHIGPGWYGLSPSQQDSLANGIYEKTRDLDFADLEIRDPDDNRLARSPVVGPDMVILKRSLEPAESLPEIT